MTGIILAGGKSKRLGVNKAFIELGSKKLIERIYLKLEKIFNEIIIVTNSLNNFRNFQAKIVRDKVPGIGPLGAILWGLEASTSKYNFITGCDSPFIKNEIIQLLMKKINQADVTIPYLKKGYEPLLAIYSKNCLEAIKKSINSRDLRIISFFSEVKVKIISENEIREYDPDLISFFNINSKTDLKRAQELITNIS